MTDLDKLLKDTLRNLRALPSRSPDELEDYLHTAILHNLERGRQAEQWMAHAYRIVQLRLRYGREAPAYIEVVEDMLPSHEPQPDHHLDIKAAIMRLGQRERELVIAYFYLDQSVPQIAKHWNMPVRATHRLLHRALRLLKKELQ